MSNTTNSKPGPESKVTSELVERVSRLVAKGIPIKVALEDEPVTVAAYRRHLQRHPELRAIQSSAKIKFLDNTTDLIFSRPNPLMRWLIERRHAADFGLDENADEDSDSDSEDSSAPKTETKPQIQTLAGVPEHLVDELRRQAQKA